MYAFEAQMPVGLRTFLQYLFESIPMHTLALDVSIHVGLVWSTIDAADFNRLPSGCSNVSAIYGIEYLYGNSYSYLFINYF